MSLSKTVQYHIEQSLTEEEKLQARTNIGAEIIRATPKSALTISPDSSGNASMTIPADVMVVIGILPATLTGVLTLTVAANSDDATMAHQYMIDFTTDVTAIPSGLSVVDGSGSSVKWVADPELSKGKHYQVSVSEGLAIIAGEA